MTEQTPNNADILARMDAIEVKTDAQTVKIDALYKALMEPQPGQDKSLLDRMASVTIAIEGGQGVGRVLVWLAGVLVALGAIWTFTHQGGNS